MHQNNYRYGIRVMADTLAYNAPLQRTATLSYAARTHARNCEQK